MARANSFKWDVPRSTLYRHAPYPGYQLLAGSTRYAALSNECGITGPLTDTFIRDGIGESLTAGRLFRCELGRTRHP